MLLNQQWDMWVAVCCHHRTLPMLAVQKSNLKLFLGGKYKLWADMASSHLCFKNITFNSKVRLGYKGSPFNYFEFEPWLTQYDCIAMTVLIIKM